MRRVLGLTGSIGMGKSTTAGMFRDAGVPVWDADAAVHQLYARDGAAVAPLARLFPDALRDGQIDRAVLRQKIATQLPALRRIEQTVHPLVAQHRQDFLDEHADAPLVVLDIPLLFETGADRLCTDTLVVSVSPEIQRERVLARGSMTESDLDNILRRQMPDAQKRARADHVIETNQIETTRTAVQDLIQRLTHA
jgi:dephospho-CoA kinase